MKRSPCDFGPWIEGGWIHGRTVAIVGGAEVWDPLETAKADVVIRINNHWQHQGGRVNVFYSALVDEPTEGMFQAMRAGRTRENPVWFFGDEKGGARCLELTNRIQATGAIYSEFSTVRSRLRPDSEHYTPRMCFLQNIMWRYGVKPYTGIVAMLHALHFDVREVFMTGFTFYAEDGKIPQWRHSHNNEINRQIVIDALDQDVRLRVDRAMAHALTLPVKN